MSEVDHAIYAKGTVAAAAPVELSIEEEAAGLARKIRATSGGEREFNIGKIQGEIRTLERNIANGYGGWTFRLAALKRTLQLVG